MPNLIWEDYSLAPFVYRKAARLKFPSSWQIFRALQFLIMKPNVSNFLLESRKWKSWNARGFETLLFLLGGLCFEPSHNEVLLRRSSLFLGSLSPSFRRHFQEKWLRTQNTRCATFPLHFFRHFFVLTVAGRIETSQRHQPRPSGRVCCRCLGGLISPRAPGEETATLSLHCTNIPAKPVIFRASKLKQPCFPFKR